jgi:hypothetical protein
VLDHAGELLFTVPDGQYSGMSTPTAADLDGDGDLELMSGQRAYHHDGSVYFAGPGLVPDWVFPHVANLDDDDEPEVLLQQMGYAIGPGATVVLEHDGAVKYSVMLGASFPFTIHDFDGDGRIGYSTATQGGDFVAVFEPDGSPLWTVPKPGGSSSSSGTAFDFLGDGSAELITGDEDFLYALDGIDGDVVMQVPRSSATGLEFEVVADVDNDGSAEIVVPASSYPGTDMTSPALQVIRDARDRWVGARRIWNQHTYHVTNVREDGTIPQFEPPHWQQLNTFRTQAQLEGGTYCKPEPEG